MSEISHAFQTNKLCHILCRLVCFPPEFCQLQHSCSFKAHVQLERELHIPEVGVLHPGLPPLQTLGFPLGWVPTAAFLGSHVWCRLPWQLLFLLKLPSQHEWQAQMPLSFSSLMTLSPTRFQPFLPPSPAWPWLSGWPPTEPSRGTGARTGRRASRGKGRLPQRCLRVVWPSMRMMCQGWERGGVPDAPVLVLPRPAVPVPSLCRTLTCLGLTTFTSAADSLFLWVSCVQYCRPRAAHTPGWLELLHLFPNEDLPSEGLELCWDLSDLRVNDLHGRDYAI